MSKNTQKKTRCPKKYTLTADEVAKLAGCSASAVKQIRIDNYIGSQKLARKVLTIDDLANEGKNLLIQEIERIVKL